MQRTIELTEAEDRTLQDLAQQTGQNVETLLAKLVVALSQTDIERDLVMARWLKASVGSKRVKSQPSVTQLEPVQSTPDVMGGDVCIRSTRIPIWLLVEYKRQGMTDGALLQAYPSLNASDLIAAWDYFASHAMEIERQIREHEEAA